MPEEYICWYCGDTIELKKEPKERVFCEECKAKFLKEHKNKVKEYGKLKLEIMYETAIRIMEKAGVYMYEYQKSAKKIYEFAKQNDITFLSSYEIITAIILDEYNFEFEVNKKVLKYEVDFYIPELKVCLEVDGHLHEFKPEYDSNRDIEIRNYLGNQWEVIRIPTKYIDKNPEKLVDAIEMLKQGKIKLRTKNNGIIPEYYSKRERALYGKYTEYKTYRVRKK